MRLSRMNKAELAVFAACYALEVERHRGKYTDNTAHERALDSALWDIECFRQALRDRKADK